MRACFTDFITIRSLSTSKSGLYIDDVKGIPTDLINKLKTSDDATMAAFWARFYETSVYTFLSEVGGKVGEKFYNNEVVESRVSGEFKTTDNTTSQTYAGVKLNFEQSRYLENQVLTVSIYADSVSSPLPDIYFFDGVGGTQLDTFTLPTLVEGQNIYNVYKTFDVDVLYIAYKPAELVLKETKVYNRYYDSQDQIVTAINQINGGGIVSEINNFCSLEKFVCSRLYALRYAFRDHLAMELMKERILTDNINKFTTLTKDKADELAGYYMKQLEKSLDTAFKHLRINDDKLCMQCRGIVSRRVLVP
jgi:hypothetical protein